MIFFPPKSTSRLLLASQDCVFPLPAWCGVVMRRNDDHLHGHRGAQQVDHLLVRQRGHRHFANLHQSAALPQPSLPGITIGLHFCNDALEIHVKTQLAQSVAAQGHLRGLTAFGQKL